MSSVATSSHTAPGQRIRSLHDDLSACTNLEPGPAVNPLFEELVGACLRTPAAQADQVLTDPTMAGVVHQLRQICSEGEYRLERSWAQRVAAAADPWVELQQFPYWANYQQLTDLELRTLHAAGARLEPASKVCFLGGGPLPLSALLMAEKHCTVVDVVDRSAEAVSLAGMVLQRLGRAERVRVHQAEAADVELVARCGVAVVAALTGADAAEKEAVLAGLHRRMRPGSLVLLRTAHGMRSLLYPPVALERLGGWRPLGLARPSGSVVNSVLVAVRD